MNGTREMVAEIIRRNEIMSIAVTVLFAAFLLLGIVLTVREHRARMKQIREVRDWQGVQIARGDTQTVNGKTFYRLH